MQKKMKEHIGFETEYKIFNLASLFETVDGHFNINCKQNEQLTTKPLEKNFHQQMSEQKQCRLTQLALDYIV